MHVEQRHLPARSGSEVLDRRQTRRPSARQGDDVSMGGRHPRQIDCVLEKCSVVRGVQCQA